MANGIFDTFLAGQQAGQEERRRKTLSDFLQPALGGDQGALSQVYSADPGLGMQLEERSARRATADQEQRMGQLELAAKAWRAATPEMRQQLYPSIAELTESVLPQFAGKIPREYSPAYEANIDKFLSGFAGGEQEQFTLGPGSTRYAADGSVIASQPFAPQKPEFVLSPDGTQWLPKPMGAPQQSGDLGPAIADPSAQGFDSLYASVPGLRVTSGMRTPEQNKAAGGVANSFHLTGQAIDIGTPTPEQRAKINQWAAQNGYEVIDNYKDGHVHLEPRGRPAQATPNGGAIPIPGANPRKTAEESFGQPQVVTDPRTGQQKLVRFGSRGTAQEVPDYAPPPTSRDAKPPAEGERNAAGYFSRMESAERELDALVASGHDPTNVRDFYTAGQGPLRNWAASDTGQQYRQQQEDWVRAKLRKESGAVIGDDEMEREIKVYFPQPGDGPEVIRKKAQSRRVAIDAMRKSGGRAIEEGSSAPAGGGSEIDSILSKYGVR